MTVTVCEISGQRLLGYESLYYDTPDLKMYTAHRNAKKTRQKIRVRTYLVGGRTYLEVKRKNNHGRTKKKRTLVPREFIMGFGADPQAKAFLEEKSWWRYEDIAPVTTTDFSRFTLVNSDMTERLTIDVNIRFRNVRSCRNAELTDLVIIELKQDGRKHSRMRDILLQRRVFPFKISKYCMGVTLTDNDARPGRFIEKVRHVERLTGSR